MNIKVWTDGGTRSNPGPGAWGVVIEGSSRISLCGYIEKTTNNQAEYRALYEACVYLSNYFRADLRDQLHTIEISSDSKLVVEQMNYRWAVKDPALAEYFRIARDAYSALEAFATVTIQHIRREFNKEADALCNQVMDAWGVVCERKH